MLWSTAYPYAPLVVSPDHAAVGIDRLAAVGVGVHGVDREIDQPALDALAGPFTHGIAADERAVEVDEVLFGAWSARRSAR